MKTRHVSKVIDVFQRTCSCLLDAWKKKYKVPITLSNLLTQTCSHFCMTEQLTCSEHAKCTYPILFVIAFVCLSCAHILYLMADKFTSRRFMKSNTQGNDNSCAVISAMLASCKIREASKIISVFNWIKHCSSLPAAARWTETEQTRSERESERERERERERARERERERERERARDERWERGVCARTLWKQDLTLVQQYRQFSETK